MLAALAKEAVVYMEQERYTVAQVEALLVKHLHRREELDLRGPRSLRLLARPPVQVTPRYSVHDSVLEKADLFRALSRIPSHYRRLLILWYGSDWSTDRIVAWYQKQFPKLHRRTVFRWHQQALEILTRQMNRNC